jgi:hypothetical protein
MGLVKNYLRYMKTTQERRRWFADEGEVKLRRARAPKTGLPNAWWDLWRRPQRSWKEFRRNRWRG